MRLAVACIAASFTFAPAVGPAQVNTSSFPYEAVVETDGAPVYSGPGGKFYETGRLRRGGRVTVHRHDPGGWYMVTPTAGDFSLVKSSDVRPVAQGVFQVTADEATVRVGSRLTPEHDVEQVPLARGDRIQAVDGVRPPAGWLAIRPPRGEYRWISGKFVVPVAGRVRSELDSDPFAVPTAAKRPESFDGPTAAGIPEPAESTSGPALTLGTPEPAAESHPGPESHSVVDEMRELDRGLEALTLTEPTDWPLDDLAAGYRRLRETHPSAGRQIDVRLSQIARMRMVQEHYDDYVRLTSATDQKDAELTGRLAGAAAPPSMPSFAGPELAGPELAGPEPAGAEPARPESDEPQLAGPAISGPELAGPPATEPTIETPEPAASQPAPPMLLSDRPPDDVSPLPAAPPAKPRPRIQGGPPYATAGTLNVARTGPPRAANPEGPMLLAPGAASPVSAVASPKPGAGPGAPRRLPVTHAPTARPAGGTQRFDAVGIVQKAVDPHPEAPQYVLVAPNGRILVYLSEQPGIPLEKFIGQPMGVDGERHKHPELSTHMIVVDRLTPVRF